MKNLATLHHQHTALASDIVFLKKEIDFLLKILRNCYSSSVHSDKIKLMDSFWKGFDQNTGKLDQLLNGIEKEERKISSLYPYTPADSLFSDRNEQEFASRMDTIRTEVVKIKESFYEFMQGCSACALKTS